MVPFQGAKAVFGSPDGAGGCGRDCEGTEEAATTGAASVLDDHRQALGAGVGEDVRLI